MEKYKYYKNKTNLVHTTGFLNNLHRVHSVKRLESQIMLNVLGAGKPNIRIMSSFSYNLKQINDMHVCILTYLLLVS